LFAFDRCLDNGTYLHLEDFGIGYCQPAATMAEHRVRFVQLLDSLRDLLNAHAEILSKLLLLLALVRDELVKRWIDEADGDGETVHGLKDPNEVTALKR